MPIIKICKECGELKPHKGLGRCSRCYRRVFYQDIKLIGCSIPYLLDYLECQFDDEMSWSNYGKWEIDHIKPCAKFDLTKEEKQIQCFNYSNLQPLWKMDNMMKGATFNE